MIEEYFSSVSGEDDWNPRYNIAPTQSVPVIRQNPKEPRRELSLMRWGLIPSWAKDMSGAAMMINARSETAATKPAFRDPLASLADSCRSRLFTFLLPFLKSTNEEEKSIYYLAAHADSSRGGIKACDHQHQTIYSATACISAASGYVVAVENGKERELTDSEERKFQTAMSGTSEEAQLQTAIHEAFLSQNLMHLRRWLAGTFFLAFWQPVWLVFTWRLDFVAHLVLFADHLDHCIHSFVQYAEPIARLKCWACRSKFAKALNELHARLARLAGL